MLQPKQLLNVHEVLQTIIVDFQAFDWQFALERVGIKLPHLIVINIQFFQLLEILQTVDFDDFIS